MTLSVSIYQYNKYSSSEYNQKTSYSWDSCHRNVHIYENTICYRFFSTITLLMDFYDQNKENETKNNKFSPEQHHQQEPPNSLLSCKDSRYNFNDLLLFRNCLKTEVFLVESLATFYRKFAQLYDHKEDCEPCDSKSIYKKHSNNINSDNQMSAHAKRTDNAPVASLATTDEEFLAHLNKPGLRSTICIYLYILVNIPINVSYSFLFLQQILSSY